jgi:uncharacterized protein (TIGR04222 family)
MIEHGAFHLAASRLAGNTWGMSGPQFLGWYLLLGSAAAATMVVLLRRATHGDGLPPMDVQRLSPMQIAVLNGGSLPAVVALVELRGRGLVDEHGRTTGAADPSDCDPVSRAVYLQLRADRAVKAREALRRPHVQRAVEQVTEQLRKGGLLTRRDRQFVRRCAWAVVPVVAVIVLGGARVAAGLANTKPVGFLVIVVIVLVASIPVALTTVATRTSDSGRRALRELQFAYPHLDPAARPSFPTYGPGVLALSVAVFGGAALVAAEPDFAYAVGAKNAAASAGYSGGGDAGGGGGCGGGGCGGGCGG